jgi:hypothetical protein
LPELRISDAGAGQDGQRRVDVTWTDGPAPRTAKASLPDPGAGDHDAELIRWYLEEYAEYPADPAPERARRAEAALAAAGTSLFDQVFASRGAAAIWALAADRLDQGRVEIDADPGAGPGLAWELLRDPDADSPVALAAAEFVRVRPQAARHPGPPEPYGDRLRVLLVIARPGRDEDVPFRSVASRLVRGGTGAMEGLDLDVLRPATFARLSEALHAAHAAGRPYHVVHFDGHGDWLDLAGLDAGSDQADGDPAGAGVSAQKYQVPVAGPVRDGPHGYLLFEDPATKANRRYVDGPSLGRLLAATGVPVLVLNACRSAYADPADQPSAPATPDTPAPVAQDGPASPADNHPDAADGPAGAASSASGAPAAADGGRAVLGADGDVHARIRAYGSLAAEIADAGVPGVAAMRYVVYVVTAAQFAADLYAHLLVGRSLGQAARRGVPTARGGRWGQSQVLSILDGRHVAGIRVFRGVEIGPGIWPAIIDVAMFREVQERRAYRAPIDRAHGLARRYYLCRGLIWCTKCGRRMAGKTNGGQPLYVCYTTKARYGLEPCARRIGAKTLESFVTDAAIALLEQHERLNAVLRFLFAAIRIGESRTPHGKFDYGRIEIEQNAI